MTLTPAAEHTGSVVRAVGRSRLEVPVERAERRHRVGHGRVGRDDVAALVARRADVELAPLPLVVFGTEGVDGPPHGVGHAVLLALFPRLREDVAARRARADREDGRSRAAEEGTVGPGVDGGLAHGLQMRIDRRASRLVQDVLRRES